jgi:hypothetical protein
MQPLRRIMPCSPRQVEPGEAGSHVNDDILIVIAIEDKTQLVPLGTRRRYTARALSQQEPISSI